MLSMSKFLYNFLFSDKSFTDIDAWIKDLRANASPDVKIFLIGNKADLEDKRKVTKERGEALKEDYGLDNFMETSAKTGLNAQLLFFQAVKLLYSEHLKYQRKVKK